MGRPSLSRKDSHAIVLFACFHGPSVRRRFRSTRVLVSHVLERSRRSATSVRSGRRIERMWISLGSALSVAQLARSVVVSVPVWWDIFPLWKVCFAARERARAWSSVTACGCVRVQLKECVDLRPSRWWPVEWGVSMVRSVFVAQRVRWAVCVEPVSMMSACGHRACKAGSFGVGFFFVCLEIQRRPFATGW